MFVYFYELSPIIPLEILSYPVPVLRPKSMQLSIHKTMWHTFSYTEQDISLAPRAPNIFLVKILLNKLQLI